METLVLPLVGIVGLYVINTRDKYKQRQKDDASTKNRVEKEKEKEKEGAIAIAGAGAGRTLAKDQAHKGDTEGFVAYTDSYFKPNENNMVLYNSRSSSTNHYHDGVLDANMGSGSQYVSKSEQTPLFAQENSVAWSYGMPSTTDYMQSRQLEIKSSKMTSVAPFQSMHVAPGDYSTDEARDRWKDKTVDELRTANNRKASEYGLYGYEGPAKHGNTQMGSIGKMEKNRVDRVFERDQNNELPSMGQYKRETARPLQIERYTNRAQTDELQQPYYGGTKSTHESRHADLEQQYYEPSKRMSLSTLPLMPASATGRQYTYEDDHGRYSSVNSHREKRKPEKNDYYGAIKGAVSHIVAPIVDTLRPSRKQYMIDNMTSYPRIQSAMPSSYVYDPDDRPAVTNRESIENSVYHLIPDAALKTGGYEVSNLASLPLTMRDKTSVQYSGTAGASSSRPRVYDAEYNTGAMTARTDSLSEWYAPGAMSLPQNYATSAMSTTQPRNRNVAALADRPQQQLAFNQQSLDREHLGQSMREGNRVIAQPMDNTYALDQLSDNPYSLHRKA